jgi:hypothetical protein
MIGETFNSVCQIAHTLFGILCVLLASYFFDAPFCGFGVLLVWSIAKEFWYDIKYEAPDISGGWVGSLEDFGFYNLGGSVGLILAVLHERL